MDGMECIKCKKIAKPAKLKFQGQDIDGWKCGCGEIYYDPEQAEKILYLNKIADETIEVKLNRNRSNLILRIPKAVEHVLDLDESRTVRLKVTGLKKMEVSCD